MNGRRTKLLRQQMREEKPKLVIYQNNPRQALNKYKRLWRKIKQSWYERD